MFDEREVLNGWGIDTSRMSDEDVRAAYVRETTRRFSAMRIAASTAGEACGQLAKTLGRFNSRLISALL
jgi:hypothetical protein